MKAVLKRFKTYGQKKKLVKCMKIEGAGFQERKKGEEIQMWLGGGGNRNG